MRFKHDPGAWLARLARTCLFAIALLAGVGCAFAQGTAPTHPLDPLTAAELVTIRDVLANSGRFSADTHFDWIALDEPAKDIVENFKTGSDFPRRAAVTAVDFQAKKTFAVIVDIKAARVASIRDIGNLQPGIDDIDVAIAKSVVDSDDRIRRALVSRGLSIPGKVSDAVPVLYYSIGHDETLDGNRDRLMRVVFGSDQNAANTNSPVLDGVMAVIDLYTKQVIDLYGHPGVPSTKVPHDIFDPKIFDPKIFDPKIFDPKAGGAVAQVNPTPARRSAEGFSVDGNVVVWRNWRFRYGFNLREGLVLYQVAVNDGGKWRPVLYRASVSEVVTAYSDPSKLWSWIEIFDEGGGGLGYSSVAVEPGREIPGNADARDVLLPDPTAAQFSSTFDKRIYVYQREAGNLMYYRQGSRTAHVRATELVIGSFASLGNYDYGFNWIFKEDGSFAFEVELAGEVLTKFVQTRNCESCAAAARGSGSASRTFESRGDDRYGTLVYPNVVAVNHQHWFNLRLDFDIDGTGNAVMENNMRRVEQKRRPSDGHADNPMFVQTHTVFARAADATRDMNDKSMRNWTIYNPTSVNRMGRPAGYTIMPGGNASAEFPMSREADTVGFTFHHFWATPLRGRELYAAGAYPDQAKKDYRDTLHYYANNDSIYDKDIVVWYSLGDIHVPRPEDYPLMSDVKLGVTFLPDGFFARNAALGPEK